MKDLAVLSIVIALYSILFGGSFLFWQDKFQVVQTWPGQGVDNLAKPSLNIGKEEQEIIEQLKREPMEADTIARTLGVSVAKIGTTLSLMQLKGFINQESGKYYIN